MKLNHKMISCIVPMGRSKPAMLALKDKFGITTANFNFARGIGKRSPLAARGWGEESEKEILNVMVDAKQADEIFAFLYHETHIDQPHQGIMYMQSIEKATQYRLPHMPAEASKEA